MATKLTIGLLTWNGEKFLPSLFESLKNQTFQDFEIIVVDNASSDGSVKITMSNCHPHENGGPELQQLDSRFRGNDNITMQFIQNPANVGFAAGHNQIFALSQSGYYLALNQDVCLAPDCLEKLVNFLDTHPDTAAVAPKLLRWDFAVTPNPLVGSDNEVVDSLGLKITRNRRVVDIKNVTCYMLQVTSLKVFGVSGACVLYRRSAIQAAGGLFDDNFFAYKEDVDLAYRLSTGGFKSQIVLGALAWHVRSGADSGADSDAKQAENKQRQSYLIKYYSYRNHWFTLIKNEYWQNFLLDFPWILWYELKKLIYFLLFDRAVLLAWKEIWRQRSLLLVQRAKVVQRRKINWKEFRKYLC